jgi:hypothetical protein
MSDISKCGVDKPLSLSSLLSKEANLPSSKLPFVWKLYEMLEDVEITGNQHIVSWVGNGRAFKVHDLKSFVDKIIPMHFNQTKFKSFQRQLYFYEFKRIPSGPDAGFYYHPKFVRGIKTLCLSMRPQTKQRKIQKQNESQNHSAQESATSSSEDPSDWMTKIQSLFVHGADLVNKKDQSKSTDEDNDFCEGDVAFVFGGMPFHYVDATKLDFTPVQIHPKDAAY